MLEIIKKVAGSCQFPARCKCTRKEAIEEIKEKKFYVFDPPDTEKQPVRVVSEYEYSQLTVVNETENAIFLGKLDKCGISGESKKCDLLVYSEEKLFLIEIKTVKLKQREANRDDAIEQLETVIKLLRAQGADLRKFPTTAVICFKSKLTVPVVSTKAAKDNFKELYGVDLIECNHVRF